MFPRKVAIVQSFKCCILNLFGSLIKPRLLELACYVFNLFECCRFVFQGMDVLEQSSYFFHHSSGHDREDNAVDTHQTAF